MLIYDFKIEKIYLSASDRMESNGVFEWGEIQLEIQCAGTPFEAAARGIK